MNFIDLEEEIPVEDTTYIVLIRNLDGDQRESKGVWKCREGFELIDDSLNGEEFIVAWKQNS